MVPTLTPSELREWAARCAAEADNPTNAARREQLLNMRDALLGLAETHGRQPGPGASEYPPGSGNGSDAGPEPSLPAIEDSGPSAELCGDFAEQCRRLAETAASEGHRAALLGMAQKWDELKLARTRP